MSEEMEIIRSPDCITEDKKHILVYAEDPYWAECECCFERFVLVSETVAKEAGLFIIPKVIGKHEGTDEK